MAVLVDGELVLYGFVGDDYWEGGFTTSQVIDALAALGRDSAVTVRINSGGGYTDDGIAIYNALTAHRGAVSIVIDAIAASAASIIAMAGDTITMRAGSLMMIHDPARSTWGDASDHEKSTEQLNKLADLMADIYAEQSGEDVARIREDMKAELWLTGAEAVERGFATDTEGGQAKAVAAFDYRAYAHAPKQLVARAKREKWSFQAVTKGAATALQIQPEKESQTMANKTGAAGSSAPEQAAAPVASAADVKARIKAITESDAAAGHASLAKHLAFDTDMPADEAINALEAAASDASLTEANIAPSPAEYQAGRSAAAALAQPVASAQSKPKASINTGTIYAARRNGKVA